MPSLLAPQAVGSSVPSREEGEVVLTTAQIDGLFQKPGCLDGYRPGPGGPLIPLDRREGEPLDTTFTVEPRWIESDGFRIRGWLYLPESGGPFPLVVLTNGGGGDGHPIKSLSDFIAPVFAHCGIAAFVHDKRGTGESEGVFRDTTFEDYILDTGNSAIALSRDPRIDVDRIGVMGGSEGGRIAVVAANRFPVFSFAISMMGPLVDVKEDRLYAQMNGLRAQGASDSLLAEVEPVWRRIIDAWASDDPAEHARIDAEIRAARERLPRRVLPPTIGEVAGNPAFDEFVPTWASLKYDYVTELDRFGKPLLAIYGGQDQVVPTQASVERILHSVAASGNEAVSVAVLPNCGHAPVDSETRDRIHFENLILNWMEGRSLRGPS